MSAAGTLVAMTAERSGAASCDGPQHFPVLPGHPRATAFEEGLPRDANQVGHLQERPVHLRRSLWRVFLLPRRQRERVQGASGGAEMAFGKMQVEGGFFQIVMPQQQLNRAQVGTGFEQVGCETMAQRVDESSPLPYRPVVRRDDRRTRLLWE